MDPEQGTHATGLYCTSVFLQIYKDAHRGFLSALYCGPICAAFKGSTRIYCLPEL